MRNFVKYSLLFAVLLSLAGCRWGADSSTSGNTTSRKYDVGVKVTNTGEGTYNNYFYLGATASTDTQSEQSAEGNVASDTTELKASLTGDGGTASFAERGAEMFMEGVSSEWTKMQEYLKENPEVPAKPVNDTPTAVKPVVIPNDPPSKINVGELQITLKPYETTTYEDGRARFLFRTTMEELPDTFYVIFKGEHLYTVNKTGDRWEPNGRSNQILKNSHGRVNSVTLLLPKNLGTGPVYLAFKDKAQNTDTAIVEYAVFHNRNVDNNRPIWYWKKQMDQYPTDFDVTMDGCGTIHIRGNKGVRIDFDENYKVTVLNTSSNRTFISPTRKELPASQIMTLVGPEECKTEKAYMSMPIK